MGRAICVMGESGSGKTTSMRNLPPEKTVYIDCDGKGLAWKGWRNSYNAERHNYLRNSNKEDIIKYLAAIDTRKEYAHVEYVVIDTINGIMVDDEMERMKEKNYDKWIDLAMAVYGIILYALKSRDNLTIMFLAHTQTERDESGYAFTRVKTSGKKLDKIVLESKFPVVLHAKNSGGRYVFEVHANNSTAKTPMGAFEQMEVDNDIMEVLKVLSEY